MPNRAWSRWKRIAHRAAEIQSLILLTVLYVLVVVPIGLLRSPGRSVPPSRPVWIERKRETNVTIEDARRQF